MSRKFGPRRRGNAKKPELIKLAVTGPRPEKMQGVPPAYVRSHMRDTLEIYLEEHDGLVHAYSGMARGVDTIFATQALRMGIDLYAMVPFEGFDAQWDEYDRKKLAELLDQAKEVRIICDEASKGAYQARNMEMVDAVNVLLPYYIPGQTGGTANCIAYAKTTSTLVRSTNITELFPTLDKSLFTE